MRVLAGTCLVLAVGLSAARAQVAGVALVDAVPSIMVGGVAKREVRPDLAVVTLGVTTDRPRATDAAGDNTQAAAAVVAAARGAGVADADIQTSQFRLFALHDQADTSKTQAFRASNDVVLRIHDLDRVGAIVGQLVAQGANDIQGIEFEVADSEPVLNDLRARATQDARQKAEIYAEAAGVRLGRVLRISPGDTGLPRPMPVFRAQAATRVQPAPVDAGMDLVETQVEVTWELVPATKP